MVVIIYAVLGLYVIFISGFFKLSISISGWGAANYIKNSFLFGFGRLPFAIFYPSISFVCRYGFSIPGVNLSDIDLATKIVAGFSGPINNILLHRLPVMKILHKLRWALLSAAIFWVLLCVILVSINFFDMSVFYFGASYFPVFILSVIFGTPYAVRLCCEKKMYALGNLIFFGAICIFSLMVFLGFDVEISVFVAALLNELGNLISRVFMVGKWNNEES